MLTNIWFASIVALLLCSNVIPNAFSAAITIFYAPLVVFVLCMMTYIPLDMWMFVGLMCLFLYNL
jgi:hypothetical protein